MEKIRQRIDPRCVSNHNVMLHNQLINSCE